MPRLKVYYNSACPVCNAGIESQRQRMRGGDAEVEWIDIHHETDAVCQIGAEREFVRERLHVVDEKGAVRIGADAFRALWKHTRGQRWLAWLMDLPLLRRLSAWLYNKFAARLYAWNRRHKRW